MNMNAMIDKNQVAQRFAQAHQSYDEHAWAQQKICQNLYALLQQYLTSKSLHAVLDIGCGSGNMSRLLEQHLNIEQLFLNDLYPEIQSHFLDLAHAQFLIGDIEHIDLDMSLDLVVSSSALQWVQHLDRVFARIAGQLKPEHLFCFSTFGPQNLKEIKQLTGHGLRYLSVTELKQCLEQQGFEVLHLSEDFYVMSFEHAKQVLKHLKATGVTATATNFRWTKNTLNDFYLAYDMLGTQTMHGQPSLPLTYHPIYCVARRVV
jgi:malonyl-CoA O-methyltransferase